MTSSDYADNLALLVNALAIAESLLHSLEQAVGVISFEEKHKWNIVDML